MNEDLEFRRARPADAARIVEIIRQAQAQMRASGSRQWQDGYPAPTHIDDDIARGYGYVLCKPAAEAVPGGPAPGGSAAGNNTTGNSAAGNSEDGNNENGNSEAGNSGTVIAYGAAIFDGEPAYEAIEGAWLTGCDYVVLHRLAVADGEKGRGVAAEFMHRVEAAARRRGVGSFRADTNFDNRYMLRLLERQGFAYCGKIRYESGERLAFEKPFGL